MRPLILIKSIVLAWIVFSPIQAKIFAATIADTTAVYRQETPQNAQGLPIEQVYLLEHKGAEVIPIKMDSTLTYFDRIGIYPGERFNPLIASAAINRIKSDPKVGDASMRVYSIGQGAPITIVIDIYMGAKSNTDKHKGFPLLYRSDKAELTLILNGAIGAFNDINPFFNNSSELNQGNPIANNITPDKSTFWGEINLEPGIGGIIEIGNSNIYAYGAATVMFTGRNSSDIYSVGGHGYTAPEKLYGGLLFTRLGPAKNQTINISYGRQTFQLNDGFLISQFSGSSNAGKRGGVDLDSRTAFNKAGIIHWSHPKWMAEAFYIEPQEMTFNNKLHIGYAGVSAGFNDNKHLNLGLSLIERVSGEGCYAISESERSNVNLPKKGMYVINPKVWISDIGGTGIFIKSEYAHQAHRKGGMSANGWYAGVGIKLKRTPLTPCFYYRYAYMQGDKPDSRIYTRFDPMLTGGLSEWVQGINMCKIVAGGNLATHRLSADMMITKSLSVNLNYYHLRAPSLYNLGGTPTLNHLTSHHLGDEVMATTNWLINDNFSLMGLISLAAPGRGIRANLPMPTKLWSTFQLSFYMYM